MIFLESAVALEASSLMTVCAQRLAGTMVDLKGVHRIPA